MTAADEEMAEYNEELRLLAAGMTNEELACFLTESVSSSVSMAEQEYGSSSDGDDWRKEHGALIEAARRLRAST